VTSDEIRSAVEAAQKPLVKRLDSIERQRTLALVVAVLSFVVAVVAVLYAINREDALQEQLKANRHSSALNRKANCAQAKTAALAPRQEPVGGETRNHYLNRLEAQREQLLAVGGLHCPSLHGFATFSYLRGQALSEIEAILHRLAPEKLRRALGIRGQLSDSGQTITTAAILPPLSVPADGGGSTGGPSHPALPSPSPGGSAPSHLSPTPASKQPPPNAPEIGVPEPSPSPSAPSEPGGQAPEPEPEPKEPGLLDPALGAVCELSRGIELCTSR
jgi:hypothetical protein